MIKPDALRGVLPDYISAQRWYAGDKPSEVEVTAIELLSDPWPALVWAIAAADGVRYQLLLGARPAGDVPAFLHGHDNEVLGLVDSEQGRVLVYEAALDSELALTFLHIVAPGIEGAQRVRPISAEQSNSSIVYDDKHILKLFRRLSATGNPDVEVTSALAGLGFTNIAVPEAVWRRDGTDLAVVQQFLAGGVEGWAMVLTSLRDLYESRADPADCGGDFAAEAERLGQVTAQMHIAMAQAFGQRPGAASEWADVIEAQLEASDLDGVPAVDLARIVHRLRQVSAAGCAVRVHGDYHLGQVMRTDIGWHVLDFEGEPLRSADERRRPTSPFKDLAGMLRSFDYATAVALREQPEADQELLGELAAAWEDRNREALLAGYLATEGVEPLVPPDTSSQTALLTAFELEKAVYEVGYERNHRPDWVHIPLAALSRLASSSGG